MADAYRVELQSDLIRVKLEMESTSFRSEFLPMESAVKLEDFRNEPAHAERTGELEDDDMEENEEEEEEEEEEMDDNSTNLGARKEKHSPFILSIKQRRWFMENYSYSPNPKAFVTKEEIASEYSKAHPESRPLPTDKISRIVKMIWGNKIRHIRKRSVNLAFEDNRKKSAYVNLIRKITHQDQAAKLSESVFCLPVSQLVIPGWTVDMFLNPLGIRYRRGIQKFYVDKLPAILEVYFTLYEEHAEDRCATTDVERSCYPMATHSIKDSNSGSSCSNASGSISNTEKHAELERNDSTNDGNNATEGDDEESCNPSGTHSALNTSHTTNTSSGTSNTDPVRTLCANILCNGRVISAEELELWDNKSVPTLGKVKTLLEVISNFKICFGYNIPESCRSLSINNECSLDPKEKVMVLHESFDDILSNKGQRKLISNDCKILISFLQNSCKNCSHIFQVVKRRKPRSQIYGNNTSLKQNHSTMTRTELEEKIKMKNVELKNCKSREKYLRMKLTGVNSTNPVESTDSESSADEEEAESES